MQRMRELEARLHASEQMFQQQRADAEAQIHRLQQENQQLRQQAAPAPAAPAAPVAPPAPTRVRPPPPPRFSHPTKQQTTGEWLFMVEMHFLAVGLVELAQRIGFVATLLDGAASSWWAIRYTDIQTGHAPDFADWQAFKEAMIGFFHPTGLEMQARMELRRIRQTGRVQAYCRIFQRLVTQVPSMDQGTIIDTFVHGLKENVRAFVRQRRPATLLQAIEAAETFEVSVEEDYRGSHVPAAHHPEPMDLSYTAAEEEQDPEDPPAPLHAVSPRRGPSPHRGARGIPRRDQRTPDRTRRVTFGPAGAARPTGRSPSPYRRTPDREQVKCWECGRFGHMARDCPQRGTREATN